MAAAFAGHAWADNLREAVDVECLDTASIFDVPAHGFGPGLGTENASAERQGLHIHAEFGGTVDQVQKISWSAAYGRHPKVFHQHNLPVGVAAGCGDDRRPQSFSAVMSAEAAGEEAITIGNLNDVSLMQAAAGETANQHRGPYVHVFLGIRDHNGFAGGSAGDVETDNVLHGAGKKSERVSVAQIALDRERQLGDVVQRANILRNEPAIIHARLEELDMLRGARNHRLHPLQLEIAEQRNRGVIRHAGGMTGGSARFQNRIHFPALWIARRPNSLWQKSSAPKKHPSGAVDPCKRNVLAPSLRDSGVILWNPLSPR